jgi:hypothetical protein
MTSKHSDDLNVNVNDVPGKDEQDEGTNEATVGALLLESESNAKNEDVQLADTTMATTTAPTNRTNDDETTDESESDGNTITVPVVNSTAIASMTVEEEGSASASDSASARGSDEQQLLRSTARVTKAAYPIPDPLSSILTACLTSHSNVNSAASSGSGDININADDIVMEESSTRSIIQTIQTVPTVTLLDSIPNALEHLLGNAFQALDVLYFQQTPSYMRNRPSFRHRLTIRVHCDAQKKQLSITDLGCGMTRADLINVFGVGSRLSPAALQASRSLMSSRKKATQTHVKISMDNAAKTAVASSNPQEEMEEPAVSRSTSTSSPEQADSNDAGDNHDTTNKDDDDDDAGSDASSDIYAEEVEDYVNDKATQLEGAMYGGADANVNADADGNHLRVPCTQKDIGGVYAALCALGTRVKVGTKVSNTTQHTSKCDFFVVCVSVSCITAVQCRLDFLHGMLISYFVPLFFSLEIQYNVPTW